MAALPPPGATLSELNAAANTLFSALSQASTPMFPNTTAGLAAVSEGAYFTVVGTGDDYAVLYRDLSGVAVEQGRYPSKAALDAAVAASANISTRASPDTLTDGQGGAIAVTSDDGMTVYGAGYTLGGTTTTTSLETRGGTTKVVLDDAQGIDIGGGFQSTTPLEGEAASDGVGGVSYRFMPGAAAFAGLTVAQDASGNVAVRNLDGKPVLTVPTSQGWWTQTEIEAMSDRARLTALQAREGLDLSRQPLDADYNVIVVYGQSNAFGSQAHPQLTLAGTPGVLMLGGSERPTTAGLTPWTPVGSAVFNPFVSTAVTDAAATTLLSQAAAAALDPAADAYGETIAGAAINYLQRIRLDAMGIDPTSRRIVVINAAVPGNSAAALSRGASPDRFSRITTALTAAKAVADAEGKTIRLAAVIYAQGEADSATPAATYKATVAQIMADIFTFGASAIFGQTRPFSVFLSQTADGGVIGNNSVQISQAQRELANERRWAIVRRVGTSKGLHHCSNGARWTGMHLGFAMRDELVSRRRFVPVQPIDALCAARGNEVLIPFQAPAPMSVGTYWSGYTLVDVIHRGLTLSDAGGSLTVTAVEVVRDYIIRVTVSRPVQGSTVTVSAGFRNVSFGNIGIYSEVTEWVPYNYEWITGMDAAANIGALVGQPYPARIPSLLFSLSVPVEAV